MNSPELLVCQALQAATSQNTDVMKEAEDKLNVWAQQPGFFPTLAQISMQTPGSQLDVNVRWMAAVYLKNGIDKYWRRNTRNELSLVEKEQVRQTLLQHFCREQVTQVATQVAVVISRIARHDCPRDWPELIPELLKRLQTYEIVDNNNSNLQQQRVLLVFHHVIKTLASRRMMAEKRTFEELASNIYKFVTDLCNALFVKFFQQSKTVSPATTLMTLECVRLATRTLRKLSIYGFSRPHRSTDCMNYLDQLFPRLRQCLEYRYELRQLIQQQPKSVECDTVLLTLEKIILKQIKTLNEFQEMHCESFARFVSLALDFSFHYVFHEGTALIFTAQVINFSQFAIHSINMMKGIMICPTYTLSAYNDPHFDKQEPHLQPPPHITIADFFTGERLSYICDKMLTHYFLLTQLELESWSADPEGFGQDDGGNWRYSMRACIETLFLTCFSQHQTAMTAEVGKYIRNAQELQLNADSDLKLILQKDAIYNAAGLASFHFFHDVDFALWFSQQLIGELRIESAHFRILRRRIIWLLGEWVGVKFAREMRPLAYEACLHLLRRDEDMSTRLSASHTLQVLVDDFEFAPMPFRPYFEACFNALFVLLGEAAECDTKMKVLMNMSSIVEKMSEYIEPQAEQLIAYLPLLWRESEDYNLLRCAIMSTLHQLVKAMRDIPESMKPFLYSIIELSTDVQQPSYIYLMEEGLTLWLVVVENSTSLSPEMLQLCTHLLPIIEKTSENMRTILQIIQAYITLNAQAYLTRYGRQFVDYCTRTFDDIRTEGIVLMLKVFETCLKSDPQYGLILLRPALPYIFRQVTENTETPIGMSMYLMIVARTLLIDQSIFMAVVQEIPQPEVLETILDVWIDKTPVVTEIEKRKLYSLAFASIFSNNPLLLERFPPIMQRICETLNDIMREEEEDEICIGGGDYELFNAQLSIKPKASADAGTPTPLRFYDSLVFHDECDLDSSKYCTMDDFENKSYHYDRLRLLSLKDPVHKIVLVEYVEYQLKGLHQQMGDDAYQRLLQTVYPPVLEKITHYMRHTVNQSANKSDNNASQAAFLR